MDKLLFNRMLHDLVNKLCNLSLSIEMEDKEYTNQFLEETINLIDIYRALVNNTVKWELWKGRIVNKPPNDYQCFLMCSIILLTSKAQIKFHIDGIEVIGQYRDPLEQEDFHCLGLNEVYLNNHLKTH